MDAAQLRLHSPQPREIALTCDRPWEENGPGYATVIQDGETYRMYYRANPGGQGRDEDPTQVTCYAESSDGIHWHKPELGIIEFNGSKQNNIIWQGTMSHNFTPFRDDNPSCPPEHRYKAVGGCKAEWGGEDLVSAVSGDGIHWERFGEAPLPLEGNVDSQNAVFWDSRAGLYRAYWRVHRRDDPTVPDGRDIATATSPDFLNWSEPQFLAYPGSPDEELYTNQIQPYYRAPHIHVGFPMRYVEGRGTLTEWHEKKAEEVPGRSYTSYTDGLFMSSRDGRTFQRWGDAFIRPGMPESTQWHYGAGHQGYGLVETASDEPAAPNDLSIYVVQRYRRDNPAIVRYTLRLDGFVSVNAPFSGGEMVTKPVTFKGDNLFLNMATSAAGSVRVEIQDAAGTSIPGFTMNDGPVLFGNAIDKQVTWKGGRTLSELAGQPTRLRFTPADADLYAFQFVQS